MIGIGSKETALKDFGTFGDIYGSLNTLFTSATLIIVLYSAYLQRQANKDAREAMAKQLRQARNATRKQLRQAQLSTKRQLALAQATHNEQMKESKHSIFLNTFNSLLSFKQSRYNSFILRNKKSNTEYISEEIFVDIARRLLWVIHNQFDKDKSDRTSIGKLYRTHLNTNLGGEERGFGELISYFGLYGKLFILINQSELSTENKIYFRKIVSNSMSIHEQLTLLWASVDVKECYDVVLGSEVFDQFYEPNLMPFLVKFFDKSCFSHPDILKNWDKFSTNQTPT